MKKKRRISLKVAIITAFTTLCAAIIAIFGLVAYRTSAEITFTKEVTLVERIAHTEATRVAEILAALKGRNKIDWQRVFYGLDETHEIYMVDAEGRTIFTTANHANHDSPLQLNAGAITELFQNPATSGAVRHNEHYLVWAKQPVPTSGLSLLYIFHELESKSYLSSLSTRLLVIAVILMWCAAWIVLIFATLISRRLNEQNAELVYRAEHDELTSLLNRHALSDNLRQALSTNNDIHKAAVFVVDINQFKEINNTLGHKIGDQLLQQVASRLRQCLRANDLIARLGADTFSVAAIVERREDCDLLVEKIISCLEPDYHISDQQLGIEVTTGIALFPDHGMEPATLIRRAEVAMFQAKRHNYIYSYYDTNNDPHTKKRLELINDLRKAIEGEELSLHYQPQLHLSSNAILSAEALVRWQHHELGLVTPDVFIPLAEQTGIIHALTFWVIENAIRFSRHLHDAGREITISINLSARNIQDHGLPGKIKGLLEKYAVAPHAITLEITETAIVTDQVKALGILNSLSEMGIPLSIDDFGTGYTSLAYLNSLPTSELKIDQSFIRDMHENSAHETMVMTIIELAHNMSHSVVAEGVEDQQTVETLIRLGCDIVQGYHLSRPMPPAQFEQWLAASFTAEPLPSLQNA